MQANYVLVAAHVPLRSVGARSVVILFLGLSLRCIDAIFKEMAIVTCAVLLCYLFIRVCCPRKG